MRIKLQYISAFIALLFLGMGAQAQIVNCPGDTVCITKDPTRGTLIWQNSTDGTTFADMAGQTGDTLCIAPTVDTWYRAVISEGDCDPVFTDTTLIEASDLTADAGADVTICDGESTTLGGNPTASGGTAPYTYDWQPAGGLNSNTDANPVATISATETYSVAVTDADGCTVSDDVIVTVDPVPTGVDSFNQSGVTHVWVVPNCVTSVSITVMGAQGESGLDFDPTHLGGIGGLGGMVSGDLAVSPGDTLWINVGSQTGANGGGQSGIGGNTFSGVGGGAS